MSINTLYKGDDDDDDDDDDNNNYAVSLPIRPTNNTSSESNPCSISKQFSGEIKNIHLKLGIRIPFLDFHALKTRRTQITININKIFML